MKIANNSTYTKLDLLKTLKEEVKQSDKVPDSLPAESQLNSANSNPPKADPKFNSEAAKLKNAAQENLTRVRVESDLAKNIDTNRLQNIKEQVKEITPEIREGHLARLIGSDVKSGSGAAGVVDGLRDLAGTRDRVSELTGGKLGDLRMVGGSLVSDDPPKGTESTENSGTKVEPPSVKDIIINFLLGQAQGRQQPIPLPPTPPDPETGQNVWNGVTFIKDVLGVGGYNDYVNKRGGIDENGTPNPEAPDSGPPVITEEVLKGIAARIGSKGEPNPESQEGSGGPINETKASGGATGPAGEPAMEIDRAVATARDIDAIRIKLESKFIRS